MRTIAANDLVEAVLDECHKPLRGRMDRIAAVVRPAGGSEVRLFALLPDRLRTQEADRAFLLCDDRVVRLRDDSGANAGGPATPAERTRVQRLRLLLDVATFGPLHRATGCRRLGDLEFELSQPEGPPWTLRLRPDNLLPAALAGPDGEVRIVDYLRTSTTWIAKHLELDGLGVCDVHLELGGLDWTPDFFAPPDEPRNTAEPVLRIAAPGTAVAETRSPTPILVEGRAAQWICVPDAGTWPQRVAAYKPLHEELERQDQLIAGFPIFWQEHGRHWLAAPFRQRPDGPAFQAPDGWQIRAVPAGKWLVVYPKDGELAGKLAAGERLLREALTQRGLEPQGAILAQPFVQLQEGEPSPEKLAAPVVRMSVALR
ncbi:MAG TPA: hypothetical protein VFZ65_15595 [Planctomycetota bacterium]|nr:hypothetical protein [Planctomycetota bacterium]